MKVKFGPNLKKKNKNFGFCQVANIAQNGILKVVQLNLDLKNTVDFSMY